MKVAAIQMVSSPVLDDNLSLVQKMLQNAAEQGVKLAVLPEYFCSMPMHEQDKFTIAERNGDILNGPIQTALSQAAKDLDLWLVAGTIPMRSPDSDQLLLNSCLVYDPKGEQVVCYDKIHLFRFDNDKEHYDETKTHQAGTTPQTFELQEDEDTTFKVGLSVCYDLRFPELYRALSAPFQKPCDIMVVPAAFAYTTGQVHWEILLRARAIENQCYIIAAAQGGEHANGRKTWGHSMIINPWGEVMSQKDFGAGLITADIDLDVIAAIRTQLPALQHRMLVD